MSFILDALKKSETERQQQGSSEFSQLPTGRDEERRAPAWLWLLAALLIVNLVVLVGLLMRNSSPQPAAAVQASSNNSEPQQLVVEPQIVARPAAEIAAEPEPTENFARQLEAVATEAAREPALEVIEAPVSVSSSTTSVPDIDELAPEDRMQIGTLRLDIHVYSDVPQDRFIFINMVKHVEGSSTSDGLLVEEIRHDGVILNYRGTRFLLPRE